MAKFLRFLPAFAFLGCFAIGSGLIAEESASLPKRFLIILDGYQGWSPQYLEEPYRSAIYNYANHAGDTVPVLKDSHSPERDIERVVSAATTWLFTRSEHQLEVLARAYAPRLRQMFERLFRSKQLQIVTSKPFGSKAFGLYTAWYDCVAASKYPSYAGRERVGANDVLGSLNRGGYNVVSGINGECKPQLTALSAFYGVQQLSTDQLTVLGFFARREQARADASGFVSAEIVRRLVDELFE